MRKLNKEMFLYIILGIEMILLCIVSFVSPNELVKFINNTLINCQYSCEDGWYLNGDMCYKKVGYKAVTPYIKGDLNNSFNIDDDDLTMLSNYLDNAYELKDNQFLIYDINNDQKINKQDYQELKTIINQKKIIYVCPNNRIITDKVNKIISYKLVDSVCHVTETKEKKPISKCNDISTKSDLY